MYSGLVTFLGSMMTYVAVPVQLKELTNSYIAVGLLGAAEIIPLVVFGLYGGALADSIDRKKMVVAMEAASTLIVGSLLVNSLLPHPHIWVLYLSAALFAAIDGFQRPSMEALIPRILPVEHMAAAANIRSIRWQFGALLGPAIAGFLIGWHGVSITYIVDIATYVVSLIFLIQMTNSPSDEHSPAPSLKSLIEGVQYAFSRKDLLGTYFVDLIAMFFAMPAALYPFLADELNAPWALGLLYSAMLVGSILATLTSGWTNRIHRHGLAIIVAATGWGVAIVVAGSTNYLWLVLTGLVIAGAADQISGVFRGTIWNQTIPVELRGRLAGIEMLSYSLGPLGGQTRAGSMAAWTSLRTSIVGGGILCIGGVLALAGALPHFRKYDSRTDEFAIAEREKRGKSKDQE